MDTEHSSPEAFRRHVRLYIGVFVALLALTAVTVWASTWKLAVPAAAVAIAIAIAVVKGGLVGGFFMHLKQERPWILSILVLTLIFFLAVIVLPLLMVMTGYAS